MPDNRIFRLGETGLARVLGQLEARIMEVLWASPAEQSVQDVCKALEPASNYKTIMTVLGRLVDKGLLRRRMEGKAYLYRPNVKRDDFLRSVADGVIEGLLHEYGDVAVAGFIDALETVSPESIAKLEQLLRQRRSQGSQVPRDGLAGGQESV